MYIYTIVLVLCRNPAVSGKILSTKEREREERDDLLTHWFLISYKIRRHIFFREIEIYSCIFQVFNIFFSEKACKGNLNKDFLQFFSNHTTKHILEKLFGAVCQLPLFCHFFHSKNRKNEIFLEDLVEPADCLLVEVKVKSHILTLKLFPGIILIFLILFFVNYCSNVTSNFKGLPTGAIF